MMLLLAATAHSRDRTLPPWSHGAVLPSWARSVHIVNREEPLFVSASGKAKRRGSAGAGAYLPIFGARRGVGCKGAWLQLGPQAWACSDEVELSGSMALPPNQRATAHSDGMPYRYYFVGSDGSFAYKSFQQVDFGSPAMTLQPGFAVAVSEQREQDGQRYGLSRRGLWLPMRDLKPAKPSAFRGIELAEIDTGSGIPVAWVIRQRAATHALRGKRFVRDGKHQRRFDQLSIHARKQYFGRTMLRIAANRWIDSRDVRQPTVASVPSEVAVSENERWIDVHLASQTLVAYEGEKPVFATLVSTGRGKTPGHPSATPKGVHRIWVKLLSSVMDNLEDDAASNYYRIEDVPYVQYFAKGVGLHAAFWHRSFGQVRSHGCVNLAPLDARRLFWWTRPHLPSGWTASLPTAYDKGTIVVVR
ncbi:MAG: L,D-transpeptidase [Polyangiaceae bacterium]